MSDDNKVKLLKIQHSLLAALAEKKEHAENEEIRNEISNELSLCLLKYKELVTQIENSIYIQLKNKIQLLLESNLILEEELDKLEEIENFYNQLLEIQTRFKQTYSLYSGEPLVLSDISYLNIDKYLTRKEAIKAYLINKKNVVDNKNKIEKINEQLVLEEQKETRINKKITFLEEEIIRRLISSEGRLLITENNQETLKYTSISSEYQNIGIKIDKAGYTGVTIEELTSIANETKEKLTAATISYEVLPSIEKKKILDEIYLENATASYHLVMAKLLVEFYTYSNDCNDAIHKRERIKDLLKYRQTYLTNLGIKFGVDPFSRLHINEQIEELKQYENNSRIISKLRHEISELNSRIETLEADNIQNLKTLENSEKKLHEKEIPETTAPSFNDYTVDIKPAEVHFLDNQVVNVRELNPDFNHKKCQEVTKNVIKRVYEVITNQQINKPTHHTPELVIEQPKYQDLSTEIFSPVSTLFVDNSEKLPEFNASEQPLNNSKITKNLTEELIKEPISPEEPVSITNETLLVSEIPANNEKISSNDSSSNKIISTASNENFDLVMPSLEQSVQEDVPNLDIFSDITPFEKPPMFTEKVDSVEPEITFPTFQIPGATNEPPSNNFEKLSINLNENNGSDANFDFWTTDADVNNIANESPVQRKGI